MLLTLSHINVNLIFMYKNVDFTVFFQIFCTIFIKNNEEQVSKLTFCLNIFLLHNLFCYFDGTPPLKSLQTEGSTWFRQTEVFSQSLVSQSSILVLVLTSLTSCRGVRSLRAVPLWPADGRVGRNVGRQRASMATQDRTWGCWWSQSALSPSGMLCLLAT